MKKMKYIVLSLVLCMLFLMGCGNNEERDVEGTCIYYINTDGTGLTKKKYSIRGESVKEKVENLLNKLMQETDSIEYNSPFPQDVEIEDWDMHGVMVDIYFNVNYNKMDPATEVLLRASIIQTLTQIQEVEYVSFFAAGQPITDDSGNEIGYQSEENFVQNIGSTLHSYQKGELTLYFADKEGKKLVGEKVSVRYNSNISMEKLIVEELIEGPMSSGLQATFSNRTKVLGVSVRDGICYVNFDENFLSDHVALDPNMTVYSLVNSIVQGGTATKVQILVNGEVNVKYHETVDLSQPFARNLEMIKGEE